MKIYSVFLLCCLVAVVPSTSLGAGKLHTFTTPDGRSLNAKIKSYNDRTRKIQIEREDGKLIWTLPSVFSEPDQKYVQQWIATDRFMSPTKFRIKGKSTKDKISKNRTEVVYEITLENKTGFPLKDLKIEYRAFILSQGYEEYKDSNRVGGGQLNIAEIPDGKKVSQQANPVSLITKFKKITEADSRGGFTTYEKKTKQEHLKGFWIKVYGPVIDGVPTIREWCNPPDTHEGFAWQEKTTRPPSINPYSGTTGNRDTHDYSDKELNLLKEAYPLSKTSPNRALELCQKCYEIAQAPRAAGEVGSLHLKHLKPTNIPLGLEWLEKAAIGNDFISCSLLTWVYVAHEEPQYRNKKKAVKYGQQAASIRPRDFYIHRMLARAYAQDSLFNDAAEHQSLAIGLYRERKDPSPSYLSRMEETLELYRNNKTE